MNKKFIRKAKTVDDLLSGEYVNNLLANIEKAKPNIRHCLVVYIDQQGQLCWHITDDTLTSQAVWMIESAKLDLLSADSED